jgi:hypothetical protein
MMNTIDPCIFGSGVYCGVRVQLRPDCSIEASAGTLILPSGKLVHVQTAKFRYYKLYKYVDDDLAKAFLEFLKIGSVNEQDPEFFQLADETSDPNTIDSIKEQHPGDTPQHNFLPDKIMAVYVKEDDSGNESMRFVLVSRHAIAKAKGIESVSALDDEGIFSRPITRKEVDISTIDSFLRPVLNLSSVAVRRFGYKKLAIVAPARGLEEDNLQHPFTGLNSFSEIFFEYKAIIDEQFDQFQNELEQLHVHFGALLSHKGGAYLEKFRKILIAKLQRFYMEGEHLYYIQYFYDWLVDLVKAYEELREKLDGYFIDCACDTGEKENGTEGQAAIVLLGPVLGAWSTYQPPIFRDLVQPALTDKKIREVRCLHWRLMMMIWTFDLPFLKMDKVLEKFGYDPGIEEKLDSTDYWEYLNGTLMEESDTEKNHLPIKLTPTKPPHTRLGHQAIPYYYPLDSNSVYSLHLFWDYEKTRMRRTDEHLSYNAHEGDDTKPFSDLVNDSYTTRKEVIMPWAFSIIPYPFLKVEGHIGKKISFSVDSNVFYFNSFNLVEYLSKYNICLDVIAVGLNRGGGGGDSKLMIELLNGLEHRPAMEQGQTLVLFFVDTENEQIELQECTKDETPEVERYTVVADFILPYRYSCCPVPEVSVLTLGAKPI